MCDTQSRTKRSDHFSSKILQKSKMVEIYIIRCRNAVRRADMTGLEATWTCNVGLDGQIIHQIDRTAVLCREPAHVNVPSNPQ